MEQHRVYRLYESLTQDHNFWLVGVAAFVCVVGSCLTSMTLRRLIVASGQRRHLQLIMSSLVTGATIWATHFIAMLAYDPVVDHGYDPILTVVSLGLAFVGALITNATMSYATGRKRFILPGIIFGLTVSVMHYVGMQAYLIPGEFVWSLIPATLSVLLGAGLGVLSYHRIIVPFTRYCWLGGAVFMGLSVVSMHFIGMSAFEIQLNATFQVPPQLMSDATMSTMVFAVVILILFIAFSGIKIETNLEGDAILQLEYAVSHDQLTGLPNRVFLSQEFTQLHHKPRFHSTLFAVVSIDLDHFKYVNDLHGQDIGDQVLRELGTRLRAMMGKDEFIARVGGDEFVAVKSNIDTEAGVIAFATAIHRQICEIMHISNCAISLKADIGVASGKGFDLDCNDLLRKADLARSSVSQDLDTPIVGYTAELDRILNDKISLMHDLRGALAGGQFELAYQLQNDAVTRQAVGCEVLLRWCHPERGMVSPVEFIPLAEESGLIQDIGRWVLQTACFEAATWSQNWSVAVNVAPQQLMLPTFVSDVSEILAQSGLDPSCLELEITEASVIHDEALTLQVLKKIKAMGVGIAMDDFGTGYSSLATLQTFPYDKIKIDRSFITDVHTNPRRAAIVRSTLSLGKAFGIPVLAEGVETEGELAFLGAEGCDYVQGFFFGKPMPVTGIRKYAIPEKIDIAS